MKTRILTPRQVLAQVDEALAQKLSFHDVAQQKPLKDVLTVLRRGRGYLGASIELATSSGSATPVAVEVESAHPAQWQFALPIKIASRRLGTLQVESEKPVSPADRVLVKQIAMRLARFLTAHGKVIMRHDRENQAKNEVRNPEDRGYQPASARTASLRMAVGHGPR